MKSFAVKLCPHSSSHMRVQGIEGQVSTNDIEKVKKHLSVRIAAVERQLAGLRQRQAEHDAQVNAELTAARAKLAKLRAARDAINDESGAFPGVVDWVFWLSRMSGVQLGAPANFDDELVALQGAGDPAFISYIDQTREFLIANGVAVTATTPVSVMIDQLEQLPTDARAAELATALRAKVEDTQLAAEAAARRFLEDEGVRQPTDTIVALRNIGSPEALFLADRLASGTAKDVGQYGLAYAAQVDQVIRGMSALRTAGVLSGDVDQRLVNGELSDAETATLRNELINTVTAFDGPGILSVESTFVALESLARLETANPGNIALARPAVETPEELATARASIATALNQAKELIGVWQAFLPGPTPPTAGDVARWVDARGNGSAQDAVDAIRALDKEIYETQATLRVLQTGLPVNTGELEAQLGEIRDGLVRRHTMLETRLQQARKDGRIVRIHELVEGDELSIDFQVDDARLPITITLDTTPFDEKADKVTQQLLFEATDYTDAERDLLQRENPDAATAQKHVNPDYNYVYVRNAKYPESQGRRLVQQLRYNRGAINGGPFQIYVPSVANYQTGTFTVTFTDTPPDDDSLPAQSVEKVFKVVVYEKKRCVRTGERFVRLFNDYGLARWTTGFTDYEHSLFFQRQVLGDPKPVIVHAGNNSQEIDDLLIKRRNFVGDLNQYHIQDALSRGDPTNPDFILGRRNQVAIGKIDAQLKTMGYGRNKAPVDPREALLRESWANAGYTMPFREYVDQLKKRAKGEWVGRHSHDPLPTPPSLERSRRRPTEAFSSGFAFPVFAERRDGQAYSQDQLWFMQAGQFVGLGGNPREFDWAKRMPNAPASPAMIIAHNLRSFYAKELPVDTRDRQYAEYLNRSLITNDVVPVPPMPRFVPIAAKAVGGFVSDGESDDESSESDPAPPISFKRTTMAAFVSDDDEPASRVVVAAPAKTMAAFESDDEPVVSKGKEEIADDASDYSYYSDDEPSQAADLTVTVSVEASPFADKFLGSSDDDDDEIEKRIAELDQSAAEMQETWRVVNEAPIPEIRSMSSNPDEVREWVAKLSKHTIMTRRASQQLLEETTSAMAELDDISSKLIQ